MTGLQQAASQYVDEIVAVYCALKIREMLTTPRYTTAFALFEALWEVCMLL